MSQSMTYDNVKIFFNSNGLDSGDSKIVLLVDVPISGGKAVRYFMLELEEKDDYWFYEQQDGTNNPTTVYLDKYDFIIIVNSNSDGVGYTDEWNMHIDTYDDGILRDTSVDYNFGDSQGNDLKVGIFQLKNSGSLSFYNDGATVARWEWDNKVKGSTCEDYDDSDWLGIWGYLTSYINYGYEYYIEMLLDNFVFLEPA